MTPGKLWNTEAEEARIPHPAPTEGVVIVDLAFELVAWDRGAGAILHDFGGSLIHGDAQLPAEVRELLSARSRADLASLILHLNIGGLEYSCRIFLVEPVIGSIQQTMFAIHLRKEASVGDSVNEVAEEYHLTDREREALGGVSLGLTTQALAKRMNISSNTVNAFLRLIMIKMGVTTRTAVVGKVLAQNGAAASRDVRTLRGGG